MHALPSLQLAPESAVLLQPEPGMHESSVHSFASSQDFGAGPVQLPPAQMSPTVQGSPSSQGVVRLL